MTLFRAALGRLSQELRVKNVKYVLRSIGGCEKHNHSFSRAAHGTQQLKIVAHPKGMQKGHVRCSETYRMTFFTPSYKAL
jgi:hypothetical protein